MHKYLSVIPPLSILVQRLHSHNDMQPIAEDVPPPESLLPDSVEQSPRSLVVETTRPKSFGQVLRIVKEDLECHGGEWSRPGFQAIALHRFGNWRMSIESDALRRPLSALYRGLNVFIRNVYGIELPHTARVGRRVIIEHQGGIVIHGSSTIGDGSILRQGVTLGNRHLDRPFEAPQIGRNVNIGAGAKVIGDVVVGDGASIGANSVVLEDVRPGAVVVGVPAAEVKRSASTSDTYH
jgi:serine O-acetyltransferase